jgi:hypothetical protein
MLMLKMFNSAYLRRQTMSKETYEVPKIEIIEFEIEDSIASSGDNGSDLICSEGLFD